MYTLETFSAMECVGESTSNRWCNICQEAFDAVPATLWVFEVHVFFLEMVETFKIQRRADGTFLLYCQQIVEDEPNEPRVRELPTMDDMKQHIAEFNQYSQYAEYAEY